MGEEPVPVSKAGGAVRRHIRMMLRGGGTYPQNDNSSDELYLCLIYAILNSGGPNGYQAAPRDDSNHPFSGDGRICFAGTQVPVAAGRTRCFWRSPWRPERLVQGK